MDTQDKAGASHIREGVDDSRQFVLHPSDDDIFVRSGRQIIEACRLNISIEVWMAECNDMLGGVSAWAKDHGARVASCYAVPRGAGIGLFFVPKSRSFDFDLADDLADLNRELVQKYNVGMVEVHQVPGDELNRFLVLEDARQVYTDANGAHHTMET